MFLPPVHVVKDKELSGIPTLSIQSVQKTPLGTVRSAIGTYTTKQAKWQKKEKEKKRQRQRGLPRKTGRSCASVVT